MKTRFTLIYLVTVSFFLGGSTVLTPTTAFGQENSSPSVKACGEFKEEHTKRAAKLFIEIRLSTIIAKPFLKYFEEQKPCWTLKRFGLTPTDYDVLKHIYQSDDLFEKFYDLETDAGFKDISQSLRVFEKNFPFSFQIPVLAHWKKRILEKNHLAHHYFNDSSTCQTAQVDITRFGEARRQGPIGWCFANAAADLASYAARVKISAADIAVQHFSQLIKDESYTGEYRSVSDLEGGLTGVALSILESKGYCRDELFPSKYFYEDLSRIWRHTSQILDLYASLMVATGSVGENIKELMLQVLPGLKGNESLLNLPFTKFRIAELADTSCGTRINLKQKFAAREMSFSGSYGVDSNSVAYFKKIDRLLKKGIPVGIGFDVHMLYEPDPLPKEYEGLENLGHAAVVVGVNFNSTRNQCEYLVRNSWGPDWRENGYTYVPRANLLKYVHQTDYLAKVR